MQRERTCFRIVIVTNISTDCELQVVYSYQHAWICCCLFGIYLQTSVNVNNKSKHVLIQPLCQNCEENSHFNESVIFRALYKDKRIVLVVIKYADMRNTASSRK